MIIALKILLVTVVEFWHKINPSLATVSRPREWAECIREYPIIIHPIQIPFQPMIQVFYFRMIFFSPTALPHEKLKHRYRDGLIVNICIQEEEFYSRYRAD